MKIKKKLKKFLVKHNIIKDHFYIDSFIYIKAGKPCKEITTIIKWLKSLCIYTYYKNIDKKAFEILNKEYPEYKGYINIY